MAAIVVFPSIFMRIDLVAPFIDVPQTKLKWRRERICRYIINQLLLHSCH
jgi:hypothetical protein